MYGIDSPDPTYDMKLELNMTGRQYGILSGIAFAALYSIVGLFMVSV